MKISIIIPVYNGEETFDECLKALTSLKYSKNDYEIVIVNDGSTDSSMKIAEQYKSSNSNLRIIDLGKNCGRVVARDTGAKNAAYENLLFIDSRVIAAENILNKIKEINYQPLMAGDLGEDKYKSDLDTLFYLIRRKVYKPYYPQTEYNKELWIDKNNFLKSPKGTTCFFIAKELFFQTSPDVKDKATNDDIILMKNIVFEKEIKLLRHLEVKAKYLQRVNNDTRLWIYQRGIRWADYYLAFLNKYMVGYWIINLILAIFIITTIITSLKYLLLLPLLFAVGMLIAGLYLAENLKDFFVVIKIFPTIFLSFYAGTIKGLIIKTLKSLK